MTDNIESNEYIIDAHPTKELFISILVRDITIRDAIGDLLDNSVDGALRLRPDGNYDGLWVKIELDAQNNRFTIEDNCGGIPVDIARNYAFRFGRSEGADMVGYSVGAFGIGMKRALFTLGKLFTVHSVARNSWFQMEVNVDEWKSDPDQDSWNFRFQDFRENLPKEFPEGERGTKITVTNLLTDVKDTFERQLEITNLIGELQREHLYSIDQGLCITVNGSILEAPELKLMVSDDFRTAYWESPDGPVKVKIFAGISEQERTNGGWYIFCNKRLVLGPDHTGITGWGTHDLIRIPEYHSQYYRFRGYAFLDAENPLNLPWNTSKTGMDLDSPVYRTVLQKMVVLMRSVLNFLDQLHREDQDAAKGKIKETPSKVAINHAKSVSLNEVRQNPAYRSPEKFVAPERARPARPVVEQTTIRYTVIKRKYDLAQEYFDVDKPEDVGLGTFNYWFEREIGE